MISRRNIRVKVMQTLYTLAASEPGDKELQKKAGSKILDEKLNRSLDLFTISILYTLRIAQYAERDAQLRSSKYLPTKEDLNVNTKIAGNDFLWSVLGNDTFKEKIKESKLEQFAEEEWIKKAYQQLTETEEYKNYISAQERTPATEKAIIQFIWDRMVAGDEAFQAHLADEIPGWEDDNEMTLVLMENFFKNNTKINFLNLISAEKREYAHNLMHTVIDKEEHCDSLIQPKLINWDSDRVALVDMLLLRMGVCELLYFPTIPTKVTINEYIEVAKVYSTPQSGQFVNGVLDNILKDLVKENKISKEERERKS